MTIGIIAGVVIFALVLLVNMRKAKIKLNYEKALAHLSDNPNDPKARLSCLETGRDFYEMEMPDTHMVDGNGNTSDHKNNAASREASIQSDIEARIGHLKHVPPPQSALPPPLSSAKPPSPASPTIVGQIKELMELHREGGLSDEEFQQLKRKLINGTSATPPPIPVRKVG